MPNLRRHVQTGNMYPWPERAIWLDIGFWESLHSSNRFRWVNHKLQRSFLWTVLANICRLPHLGPWRVYAVDVARLPSTLPQHWNLQHTSWRFSALGETIFSLLITPNLGITAPFLLKNLSFVLLLFTCTLYKISLMFQCEKNWLNIALTLWNQLL